MPPIIEKKSQDSHKEPEMKIWNDSEVDLLKRWGEVSSSYRFLHDRAFRIFQLRNYCFTIPVIVLSTISGTASFSISSFPVDLQVYVPMVIGGINIFVGIVQTIAQFLRISELAESHRVASTAYGKFSRNIATELSLPPNNRTYNRIDFVQMCRAEMDRLLEQSPIIPRNLLSDFDKNPIFQNITKPDVLKITEIVSNAFSTFDEKDCGRLPAATLLLRATKRKRLPLVHINLNPDNDSYEKLLYEYRNNDKNTGSRLYYAPFPGMSFSIVFMCLRMSVDEYYCQWTKDFGFAGPVLMFATYHDEKGEHSANTSLPLDQSILDEDCMLLLGILARISLESGTCTCTKCDDEWRTNLFGANRHIVSPKNHCHNCRDLMIRDDDHPLWKCGKCKNVYYCSKECQKNNWPNHRTSCVPFTDKF